MNKRKTGSRHEKQAAAFLEKQGLKIVERNFYCRNGEIDLVARDGEYLVFVEVKYRSTSASGMAAAAVDIRKQRRISRAAQFYLLRYGYGEVPCRFDVVAIDKNEIRWIRNAFDYCG
ncbi:MAG: YraN family protein [Eubacteriales bacterium]|nr:YraN family protein [Eubacteriales bacterium]